MTLRRIKIVLLTAGLSLVACVAYATEKCKECHADIVAKHASTLHGKAGKSCDACHGGVDAHLASGSKKDIITFDKGDTQKQNEQCLACHAKNQNLMFWDNSKHKAEDIACISCHSVHKAAKPQPQQPEKCFECHKDIRALANQFTHHPVIEGKVKCSDCHNPHGTLGHGMIRAENVNQLCYKCHADKRGPYVWEHAPVEEDCSKCHSPHGSKTIKLLTEKMPRLCENCHDANQHPGAIYGANRSFQPVQPPSSTVNPGRGGLGRGCTGCHGSIHGSNAPATNGRYFIR